MRGDVIVVVESTEARGRAGDRTLAEPRSRPRKVQLWAGAGARAGAGGAGARSYGGGAPSRHVRPGDADLLGAAVVRQRHERSRVPALDEVAPRPLDQPRHEHLALPLQRRRHRIVVDPFRSLLDVAQFAARVADRPQEVLGQRVEDVDAVDAVVLADRDVHRDQLVEVRRRQPQRLLEFVDELRQATERNVLRRRLVELFPRLVVHVEVVLRQTLLDVFRRLHVQSPRITVSEWVGGWVGE